MLAHVKNCEQFSCKRLYVVYNILYMKSIFRHGSMDITEEVKIYNGVETKSIKKSQRLYMNIGNVKENNMCIKIQKNPNQFTKKILTALIFMNFFGFSV